MNVGSKTTNGLLFADFNQDSRFSVANRSCISVGTRTGYKIYTCDPFGKCYGKRGGGGIGIAEMLFCTSLVALVGAGEHPSYSPRRLQIVNTKRQSTICDLTFATAVLGVRLNRKRLAVVLEEHIYIYDIGNMKILHTIDTTPNPLALCALAPSSDNCYLAYPSNSSSNAGELMVFDTIKLQALNIIHAHKSPLSCVVFNQDGTLCATSSDKGTVIRVFSCPDGGQLYQFRRGTYSARISSLAFSLNSAMLCVSSDSDTIHIYKVAKKQTTSDEELLAEENNRRQSLGRQSSSSVLGSLRSPLVSAASQVGTYFPSTVSNIWEPQRHFGFAKLPIGSKDRLNICSFAPIDSPFLIVVTSDGFFYSYAIPEAGGECTLQRQDSIMDVEEE